ncbi:MAG: hypothetical protein HQL52_04145 [Magnetococcales bacterium]|nr:hypothetical protein [Magnetococcales bacterium]
MSSFLKEPVYGASFQFIRALRDVLPRGRPGEFLIDRSLIAPKRFFGDPPFFCDWGMVGVWVDFYKRIRAKKSMNCAGCWFDGGDGLVSYLFISKKSDLLFVFWGWFWLEMGCRQGAKNTTLKRWNDERAIKKMPTCLVLISLKSQLVKA